MLAPFLRFLLASRVARLRRQDDSLIPSNSRENPAPALKWRGPWAFTGWTLIVLGGAAALGWLIGARLLLQPFTGQPAIRPLSGLSLLGLGIAVLAFDRGRRRAVFFGAGVALAVGFAVLVEYSTGVSLGLQTILYDTALDLKLSPVHYSGMPLSSAVGFLLAGAALIIMALPLRPAVSTFGIGLLGSTLVALNVVLLLGQLFGIAAGIHFGQIAGSSPQTTVGLLGLGLTLAYSAWSRDWVPSTLPAWLPWATGLASLTAVLFLWRVLIQWEREKGLALLAAAARSVQVAAAEKVEETTFGLWRVARFSSSARIGSPRWTRYAEGVLHEVGGLQGIGWMPNDGATLTLVPAAAGVTKTRESLYWELQGDGPLTVEKSDSVRYFPLQDPAGMFVTAVPQCDLETCEGFVVGLYRADELLGPIVGDSGDGYHREISWEGRALAGSGGSRSEHSPWTDRSSLRLGDMTWELSVWPTGETLDRVRSPLPGIVLIFGLLVSGLLPLTLQLVRTVTANVKTTEQARLSLMLGRAMDRTWSWEVPGRGKVPAELRPSSAGQEVRSGQWTTLIHPDDRRRVETQLQAHLEGRTSAFEAEYRVRDGGGGWHWRVDRGRVAERGPYGTPLQMLGVSGDVSERRRADEEREASERRFRAIFDSAYQFQGLLDLEGRLLEANQTALHFLGPGMTIREVRGVEFWRAPWWRTPEVEAKVHAACLAARAGRPVRHELELDGSGRPQVILDFSVKPILDPDGAVVQLLAEGRDITAGRRAENELREVETLTTMGRLAARVAHEINNPLAGIQNSFLLIRDAVSPKHPHHAYVGAIEREIGRIAAVTRQLYETYRPESDGSGQTGVRVVIGDAVAFLEQVNRQSQVRIVADLVSAPSVVPIPESVVRQTVYNLVQNAVEASPQGGKVTVQADIEGTMFVLRVHDQGSGIPPEARERVFEPFVSNKGRGVATGGMGIGLALVRRSVQALGGTITIVDPPDGGTEFVVRIPIDSKRPGGAT